MSRRGEGPSLRRTLLTAFGVVALLLLLTGLGGLAAVTATARSVDELTRRVQPAELANAELHAALSESSRGLRGYLLSGERRFLEAYERGVRAYPRALGQLRSLQTPDEAALVDEQERLADDYFRRYSGAATRQPTPAEAQALLDDGKAILDRFIVANDALTGLLRDKQTDIEQTVDRVRTLLFLALGTLAALGTALTSWVGLRTTRAVTGPLADLRHTLGRVTEGDLSVRVKPGPHAPREVCDVAASVNRLAQEGERFQLAEQERARMRDAAVAAGRRTQEHLDLDAVLTAGVEAVGQALRADRAYVWRVGEERTGWVQRQWSAVGVPPLGEGDAGPSWPFPTGPSEWIRDRAARGASFVTADVTREPELATEAGRRTLAVTQSKSLIIVPLMIGSEAYGMLTVSAVCAPRSWTQVEVELAEAVAADLARALHRAQLFEQQRELVEQLRELDRTKTDFLSTVSHELRTPLTSISGYIELLRDGAVGPITPEQDRMLDVVDRNTQRLRGLIEDLLTLSRIESGGVTMRVQAVDVAALARGAAETVRPAALNAGLTLELDLAWDAHRRVQVQGDQDQLDRVLLNLLSNAVKFSRPGGVVTLRAQLQPERDGQAVVLAVSDTGIGIPAREQAQLFSRFFRASNATEQAIQGTGLGLTIVRSIVERHGGELELESAENVGTTVRLRLPALAVDVGEGMPAGAAAFSAAVPSSGTLS